MNLQQIITDTVKAVPEVIPYLSPDAQAFVRLYTPRAQKADGGIEGIGAMYHKAITEALITFFEGGSVTAPRNAMRRAASSAFLDAFELGWTDGGGSLPMDVDALAWLDARLNTEFGYIGELFESAKLLRKEDGFDFFEWVTFHADNYRQTLREIYNSGILRVIQDMMVTFDGDDGAESCKDCQKLKGKRHKVSWFVARNYIPPFGTGLECHPGRRCQHGLRDDKGNWITV